MVNASTIIGAVIMVSRGSSSISYQDPTTYNSTQAYITPLGEQQEFELGSFLRNTYLNSNSSSFIQNISTDVVNIDQLTIRADAGGGNVILNSAYALAQGLYPACPQPMTLANGDTVTSPLDGYQYVPVQSLEFWQSPSLTSWMDCEYFQYHLQRLYASSAFINMSTTAAPFLTALKPYLGGVNNTLTNMWNVYDYVDFQNTYNKTYYESLPATFIEQARYYADWLQQQVFTDSVQNGVGQIAIRTLFPEITWALGNMTQPSNTLKLSIQEVDYKPFISLFNVTNATLTDPDIAGIANYASALAFELSLDSQGQYQVSMKFKNGTQDSEFRQLQMFGNASITLDKFKSELLWTTINSTNNWCFSCNQTTLRGCSVYNFSQDPFLNGF